MWEPTEFSLSEVLASTCRITEKELAQIIWPVRAGSFLLQASYLLIIDRF
jgi:hypothetical protein